MRLLEKKQHCVEVTGPCARIVRLTFVRLQRPEPAECLLGSCRTLLAAERLRAEIRGTSLDARWHCRLRLCRWISQVCPNGDP